MDNQPTKKLDDLPASTDEYWEGAEATYNHPVRIDLCGTHDYLQQGNTAMCTRCPYGTILPGYMRVLNGKIIDLRDFTGN